MATGECPPESDENLSLISGITTTPGQDLLDFYDAHISTDRYHLSIPKRDPPLDDLDGTRLKGKRNEPEKKSISSTSSRLMAHTLAMIRPSSSTRLLADDWLDATNAPERRS